MDVLKKVERRSKSFIIAACLGFIGVIGATDFITGSEIFFSVFYLLAVGAGTWFVGRTVKAEGASPNVQANVAPETTCMGIRFSISCRVQSALTPMAGSSNHSAPCSNTQGRELQGCHLEVAVDS